MALEFDIGTDNRIYLNGKPPCSIKSETEKLKRDIVDKSFRALYQIPTVNRAYIDTINGRVATIIIPKIIGTGLTQISIQDCKTETWIGIKAKNLRAQNHDMVLRMLKTINR